MTSFGANRRIIDCHLDTWKVGEFGMLAEDMARNCAKAQMKSVCDMLRTQI